MQINPSYSPSPSPSSESYLSRLKNRLLSCLSKLTPHKGDSTTSNVVKATFLPVTVTLSPIIAIASAILAIPSKKNNEEIELKDLASSPSTFSIDAVIGRSEENPSDRLIIVINQNNTTPSDHSKSLKAARGLLQHLETNIEEKYEAFKQCTKEAQIKFLKDQLNTYMKNHLTDKAGIAFSITIGVPTRTGKSGYTFTYPNPSTPTQTPAPPPSTPSTPSTPSKPIKHGLIDEVTLDKQFQIDKEIVTVKAHVEGLEGDREKAIKTFSEGFETAFKAQASKYKASTSKAALIESICREILKEIKPLQPLSFAAAILIPESEKKSTLYTLSLGNYQILANDKPLNSTQTIASNPQIRHLALAGLLKTGNLTIPHFDQVFNEAILPYLEALITRFPSEPELFKKGTDEEKLVVHKDLKTLKTLNNLLEELKKNPPSEKSFQETYLPKLQQLSLPRIHPECSWLQEDLETLMGPLVVENKFIESEFDKDGKLQFKNRGTALGLQDSKSLNELEIKAHENFKGTPLKFKKVD